MSDHDDGESRNSEPDTAPAPKRDTRFKPGNPGKPKGARNRATRMVEALFENEAEDIGKAAIEAAKGGDVQAMKLILDRLAPARRTRHIAIDLPKIETAADLLAAQGVVVEAMAGGQMTPLVTGSNSVARETRACQQCGLPASGSEGLIVSDRHRPKISGASSPSTRTAQPSIP